MQFANWQYVKLLKTSFFTINFLLQVVFEGIRGESYQGDAAIDDIHFLNGNCP